MAPFTINPLQQKQFFSIALCNSPTPLPTTFKSHFSSRFLTFSPAKHSFQLILSPLLEVREDVVTYMDTTKLSTSTDQELSKSKVNHRTGRDTVIGISRFRPKDKRLDRKYVENNVSSIVEDILEKTVRKDRQTKKRSDFRKRSETCYGSSSMRSKNANLTKYLFKSRVSVADNEKNRDDNRLGEEKRGYRSRKFKADSPEILFRVGLDMCSKRGDVMGAIELYDSARREGIKMRQYHFTVLLYLCSSAATGVVQPAKSGSGSRSLSMVDDLDNNFTRKGSLTQISNESKKQGHQVLRRGDDESTNIKDGSSYHEDNEIQVSVDIKRYALQRGFEIYETMHLEKVPMNEATFTSVARMAMSMGNGDMAFDMVKQMKALGINPRLRSYGPALFVFCNNGDIEKAFTVEEHMLEHGVSPEEPELEALLRVSIDAGRSDKVYYLLHKLRTNVRKVSPSTADLIKMWFKSKTASRVGKRKWDQKLIREAIENGGGGWHGQGWLGKGKWTVSHTSVGADGLCKCCGEKLATIDLDPTETENFANSVASLAIQREKNSRFQKFQKWLDYYGPFEAVVDAANVGLFSQRKFKPSKVNAVVNGIRQMLPSKKWPLIVLHNRRITGDKMDEPVNKALIEKWKNADALYATPTGSNDDWYWLYAAIKFKCLIVTNDEMRDHLFQLLGNDFFSRWKERHQVHFSFSETGPVFRMPPPCSVVIQESEKGHWHIPIVSGEDTEGERIWLCATRAGSHKARQASATKHEECQFPHHKKARATLETRTETQAILPPLNHSNCEISKHPHQEIYRNLRNILSTSIFSNHPTILPEIEAAEELGSCVIDFQI